MVTCLQCGVKSDKSILLLSGSRDKSIIQWNLDMENPQDIKGERVQKDNNGEEVTVDAVIDKRLGKPFKSLHGHSHFVSGLSLSSDSKKLLSSSWDKTARLWDLSEFKTIQLFKGHEKDLLSVSFSQDNRKVVTGAMDKTMKIWNTKGVQSTSYGRFNGWVNTINSFSKSKNEKLMAVGCTDGDVTIYDEAEFTEKCKLKGETEYGVTAICDSGEEAFMFVAYKNGDVKAWNYAEGEPYVKKAYNVNCEVNVIKYDPNNASVVVLGTNKGLQLRSPSGKLIYNKDTKSPILCLCYDAKKEYIFTGCADGTIRVFQISKSVSK